MCNYVNISYMFYVKLSGSAAGSAPRMTTKNRQLSTPQLSPPDYHS